MRHARHLLVLILPIALIALSAIANTACAPTARAQWPQQTPMPMPAPASAASAANASTQVSVFVMQPFFSGIATGNAGSNFDMVEQSVALSILAAVRERMPGARWIRTQEEMEAARWAYAEGATHVIVPDITEWRQMRTDDPIGAIILPHNRIGISLRLVRVRPRPMVTTGRVVFTNHARFTVNQSAERLLDDRFRDVVIELIRTGT
jgi:hypothetical protein